MIERYSLETGFIAKDINIVLDADKFAIHSQIQNALGAHLTPTINGLNTLHIAHIGQSLERRIRKQIWILHKMW